MRFERERRLPPPLIAMAIIAGCNRTPPAAQTTAPPPSASTPTAAASAGAAAVAAELGRDAKETRLYDGAPAHLTDDGKTYLVVGGYTDDGAEGRAADVVVYDEKDGKFTVAWQATWHGGKESTVRNVRVADLDGDGKDEIVVLGRVGESSRTSQAQLKVLGVRANALAVLAETTWQSGTYTSGYGLDVGDLDGDKKPEIVAGGFFGTPDAELAEVRVLRLAGTTFSLVARTTIKDEAFPSARINAIALGDLDGDGRPEIVTAGRDGALKHATTAPDASKRREQGEVTAWSLRDGKLASRGRYVYLKGASSRLRAASVADFDGDKKSEILVAGQIDEDGRPCLALLRAQGDALVLSDDASFADAVGGEVKDVVLAGEGPGLRVITAGPVGAKPHRQGRVQTWKVVGGKLVLDKTMTSVHGDETRARGLIVWPTPEGARLLTIGHAKNEGATQMVGQLLDWGTGP